MEALQIVLPREVIIFFCCALGCAPCRPVRYDRLILTFELSALIFTLCAMLQGRTNFFMDETSTFKLTIEDATPHAQHER